MQKLDGEKVVVREDIGRPISKQAAMKIAASFEMLLPELTSRSLRMARRYPRRYQQDAADDALGAMFLNFAGAARKGRLLTGKELGWAAVKHLRGRSTIARRTYPSRREQCMVRFQDLGALEERLSKDRLAQTLTTSELDDPAVRAQQRLDWTAFAQGQPKRVRRILLGLARGDEKGLIAKRIGVSAGRLSQLLLLIGREVVAFFGPDAIPYLK